MFFPHRVLQRAPMLGGWGLGCLSQSSTESGSVTSLVSGSRRHRPQPTIGPLLYTTMAASVIVPVGLEGTRVLARQPSRKHRLTREMHRCLDYNELVNIMSNVINLCACVLSCTWPQWGKVQCCTRWRWRWPPGCRVFPAGRDSSPELGHLHKQQLLATVNFDLMSKYV